MNLNDSQPSQNESSGTWQKTKEVAYVFLKLGTIGFGGPAAHVVLMHNEVVKKRKWMDDQHFLDMLGATSWVSDPARLLLSCWAPLAPVYRP